MLQNTDGSKRGKVTISDNVWKELRTATYEGIKGKLTASQQLLKACGSVEIVAGLYTFAPLEELWRTKIRVADVRALAKRIYEEAISKEITPERYIDYNAY